MPNLRSIFPLVLLTLTFSTFAQEPPADAPATTSATVASVISAGTLRLQTPAGEEMVVLHGVLAPVSTSPLGSKAKQEVTKLLQGKKLTLEERAKLGGIAEVVAYLDNGECLNEFLVSSGLAMWDRVTAPDYVQLKNAQDSAKRHQVGLWAGTDTTEEAEKIDAGARLEEYKQKSNLRRQAFFDAAYEKWITLSDEEQLALYTSVNEAQQHVANVGDARVSGLENKAANLESAAQSKAAEADESRNLMAELQQQRNEEMNTINNTSPVVNSPIQVVGNVGFFSQDTFATSWGLQYNSQIDNVQWIGDGYFWRMDNRAAETQQRYDDALHAEAATAAAAERERGQLQADAQAVRTQQQATANLQDRLTIEAESTRGVLLQLRQAQNAKYVPVSTKTEVARLKNTDASDTIDVKIASKVWRVSCDTPKGSDAAGLTIDVYQGDATTPFRRLTADAPSFRRFLVLDEPGAFTLKIQNPNNVAFTVTVYEISGV